jgi:uncharacterized membrane protein HdeD (DUF308 family)
MSATTTTPIFVAAKRSLTWSIVLSVLMIVAGVLAIIIPPVAGIAVTLLVGWLLIFSGVAHLVFAWHTRGAGAILWELLLGVLYMLVGAYLLWNPVLGLTSLTLGLAMYLIVEAVLEFILAMRLRPMPGSGWLFVDGIITLILAIMIWRMWPSSAVWAIGILVGISMIFSGVSRLMLSVAARHLLNKVA